MFRGVVVGKLDGFIDGSNDGDQAVGGERFASNRFSFQLCHLNSKLSLNEHCQPLTRRDQYSACHGVMFGLSEHVRSGQTWIGRCIRNDDCFGRARQLVDRNLPENLTLRQHHEDVARTEDLVDPGHRFRSVGKCGYCLGATDL